MKKILGLFLLFTILTVQTMSAGYSVVPHSNPNKFIEEVRENEKKYCEVLEEETQGKFKIYTYILDFQIISQISGEKHVATVTGLVDKPHEVQRMIEQAKKDIDEKESSYDFALKRKEKKSFPST